MHTRNLGFPVLILLASMFLAGFASQDADEIPAQVHEAHRKLFDQAAGSWNLVARSKSEGDVVIMREVPQPFFELPPPGNSVADFAKTHGCKADAIVIGTVLSKSSFLSSLENWVFTDHAIEINEVIRDNKSASIASGSTIVVARGGGKVLQPDGHTISVSRAGYPPLIVGSKYFLVLRSISETGAYRTNAGDNVFRVMGDKAVRMFPEALDGEKDKAVNLADLSSYMRLANCEPKK